jgi:hypothetical protein
MLGHALDRTASNHQLRKLRGGIIMTTCKCRETETDGLVMTRAYLEDLLAAKKRAVRNSTIEEILNIIQTHQNLWFSQSLNIGSGAYWANKSSTAQVLVTEIRKKLQ